MRRFARQVKLPEIGAAGQAKLEAATAEVGHGFAGWVAARYLRAAGVRAIVVGVGPGREDARFDALDPAARDFAVGAHDAIIAIKQILG